MKCRDFNGHVHDALCVSFITRSIADEPIPTVDHHVCVRGLFYALGNLR